MKSHCMAPTFKTTMFEAPQAPATTMHTADDFQSKVEYVRQLSVHHHPRLAVDNSPAYHSSGEVIVEEIVKIISLAPAKRYQLDNNNK